LLQPELTRQPRVFWEMFMQGSRQRKGDGAAHPQTGGGAAAGMEDRAFGGNFHENISEGISESWREAAEPIKEKIRESAEQQKHAGAEQLSGIARAIHSAADELRGQFPQGAEYIDHAAESVSQASSMLRDRPAEELLRELNGLAQRQPLVVFGASVLAGFAMARFLKSSAMPPHGQPEHHSSFDASSNPAL
jgi:hypothetical protein